MNKCSQKPRGRSRQMWKTYAMETQKTSKEIERDNNNEKMQIVDKEKANDNPKE